jgi:hypothetical protein
MTTLKAFGVALSLTLISIAFLTPGVMPGGSLF